MFDAGKGIDGGKKKEQREFLDKELAPRLEEAKSGKRKVFFVDAAHFVMGSFLGYSWCKVRKFVPSSSGRKRYNVLGALDAITHELVTVCNDSYINALSICELLRKIRDSVNVDEIITLVLDNAAYQRCALVTELAKNLKIELLFLPSYSPNLNLIERIWRWLRSDCLNGNYFESFDELRYTIRQSLLMVSYGKKKEEMDSLLALNFQLFDNA
jgi:transposase